MIDENEYKEFCHRLIPEIKPFPENVKLAYDLLCVLQTDFHCHSCGYCCKSYVSLHKQDILRLSKALSLTEEQFIKKYTNPSEHGTEYEFTKCAFYEGKCKVYDYRPFLCRTYPFLIDPRDLSVIIEDVTFCKGAREIYDKIFAACPDAKAPDFEDTTQSQYAKIPISIIYEYL